MRANRFVPMGFCLVAFGCVMACLPSVSRGDIQFTVSLDTSDLIGNAAGPFSLDFQLNDGSQTGDGNNTATISNFVFAGATAGGPSGSPTTASGGVTGSLASTVSLTDTSDFNEFTQAFTPGTSPGSTLSFSVDLTTNVDAGPTPDQFSFAILDNLGDEIPTVDPSGANTLITVNIDSSSPTVNVFDTDPSIIPNAGGTGIDIEPDVNILNAGTGGAGSGSVPLPTAAALGLTGLCLAAALQCRCRRVGA